MAENNANVEDAWASFWYQDVLFVFFGVPECVAKVPRLSLGVWDLVCSTLHFLSNAAP